MAIVDTVRGFFGRPAEDEAVVPSPLNVSDASSVSPDTDVPAYVAPEGPGAVVTAAGTAPGSAEAAPPETTTVPARTGTKTGRHSIFTSYQTTVYGEPHHEAAYEHGHIDGTFHGDADAFRALIEESEEVRLIDLQIAQATARREQLVEERKIRAEVDVRRAAAPHRVAHLERAADTETARREEARAHLDASVALEESTRDKASWANVWIYALATVAFLVGDVIVSKQIVATVLKLPDAPLFGMSERWWFAIGIALLAMIVKLAYERMVEKPFLREGRGPFRWIVLVAVAATLVTLGMLGWTRAYYTDTMSQSGRMTEAQIAAAAAQQAGAVGSAAVVDTPPTPEHHTPLPVVLAFIATAVLFAITGGICGGVAVQAWHVQVDERWPARKRLKEAQQRDVIADQDLRAALNAHTTLREALAADDERVQHLRPVADLDPLIDRLDGTLDTLLADRRTARTAALRHSYNSGFALAEANRMHLDETPGATMLVLTELVGQLLDALENGTVDAFAAQGLLGDVRRFTNAYLGGTLPPEAFLTFLAEARRSFDTLLEAGGSDPDASDQRGVPGTSGDGVRGPKQPRPRPHLWMRDEMARLSSR